MPHAGAEFRANPVPVTCVCSGARCVHLFEGEVVLKHLGVVFEASARHDHTFTRFYVDPLSLFIVYAAEHGFGFGVLNKRGQRCVRFAGDRIGVLLQYRTQKLAYMLAVFVGVVLFELAF